MPKPTPVMSPELHAFLSERARSSWIHVSLWMPPPSTPENIVRVQVYVPDMRGGMDSARGRICEGWYYGAPLNEWRVDGTPTRWRVSHWQPLPGRPL